MSSPTLLRMTGNILLGGSVATALAVAATTVLTQQKLLYWPLVAVGSAATLVALSWRWRERPWSGEIHNLLASSPVLATHAEGTGSNWRGPHGDCQAS